ncbi:LacI family DNA-binding transcriptional regulator [Burkholderia sp. Ac-20379]|uniref:LacI family DNA-binding transcriptional regulator n=1 Tax=Burkholderia sp. Ac-20379 TaxID=2703900 RepID=UPI001982499A|nr:LacI family DNA-binding transcriptional regulator [Burkholderia sp. Ac-20379]MBN3722676.1 LacI family transcriptional regulator [Burkholderia sp. Ac-20379]
MAETPSKARRKRAPRFADIAAEAGVSEATVDRVLNERGSVSATARERVVSAAARLGVTRRLPDTRHGIVHVDVVLPINHTPFFRRIDAALQRAISALDQRIVVHRLRVDDRPDEFTQAMVSPPYPRAGLIIASPSSPSTIAALSAVAASGVPVVTVVSDLPEVDRRRYVGIDHYEAGRTAGYALGRFCGGVGNVLVLPAVRDYLAHRERVRGCVDELAEHFPGCRAIVPDADTRDDPSRCYAAVQSTLREQPIEGIYSTGDGAEGIESALKRAGRLGRVTWVGHEIDDVHRRLLDARQMDLVIDQDPDGQAIAALDYLLRASGETTGGVTPAFDGEFRLYMPTNARRSAYL